MTPGELTPRRNERDEQRTVAAWARWHPVARHAFFHVPNERPHRAEARVLASAGVRAGVPDNWLMLSRAGYAGAISELKRQGATPSRLTDPQRRWLTHLARERYYCGVHCGADAAIAFFERYLALPETPAPCAPVHLEWPEHGGGEL